MSTPTITASSPDVPISKAKTPLSRSPGRSPSRVYGSIISQPSPPPPPPGQQPRRSIKYVDPLLEPEMMDLFRSHPTQPIVTPPPSSKMIMPAPPPQDTAITATPMTATTTEGVSGWISPPFFRASLTTTLSSERKHSPPGPSPLQQLPVLRSCTFYALRIIYFPKTVFVKTVALGRGCVSRIGLASSPYRGRRQQYSRPRNSHQGRDRRGEGELHHHSQSGPDHGHPPSSRRRPRPSGFRSRSRSPPQTSTTTTTDMEATSRWKEFLDSYHVQVGMICLCMTGESIAQSVICPFLYIMVRDFHVGLDIWIGYYAGLLLTGYWGANLCTTLFWGHLSDKYGRKAVLLFGLFMTSLSTIYLGLTTCYHDAMLALVLQGACTGLVPISKCAIGEIANRQQRIYDAQMAALPRHRHRHRQHQRPTHPPPSYEESYQQQDYVANEKGDIDGEAKFVCSSPECDEEVVRERQLQPREDYAAKGYSGLVIAVAIGAALGPLMGGSLAKKQIPGFEKYTYLAPCLLAAGVGLLFTCLVALILNETNPKWAKPLPQHLLEPSRETHSADTARRASTTTTATRRGRLGYEQSRWFLLKEGILNKPCSSKSNSSCRQSEEEEEEEEEEEVDYGGGVGSSGTRPRRPHPTPQPLSLTYPLEHPHDQLPLTICTCLNTSTAAPSISTPPSLPKTTLSPATQLVLILAIYSLLVLTSILGSEFVMLYTQSPIARGGLEFSAKILGQVLTMRGILKLTFNLFGYPFLVRRLGLIRCLRLGIAVIGTVSVLGLGWAVPWRVQWEGSDGGGGGGGSAGTTAADGTIRMDEAASLASAAGHHGRFNNHNNSNGVMGGDRTPIGMSVVLLCLSMISMGDVLGYISVLVLFGKSADRFKGTNRNAAGSGSENNASSSSNASDLQLPSQQQQQQSGSGVLWSVAQVSANVMRLTGPVLAGLLWTLTGQGPYGAQLDNTTGPPTTQHILSAASESTTSSRASSQTTFSMPDPMDDTMAPNVDATSFAAIASRIFNGPTNVFYLVGAISLLNFVACQLLLLTSSSSSCAAWTVDGEDRYYGDVDPEKVSELCSAPRQRAVGGRGVPAESTKCPVHPRRSPLVQMEDA